MFEPKQVQRRQLLPLAAAYVAYIVLCNLNLNINPVGFYQITKIAGLCACCAAALCVTGLLLGSRMSTASEHALPLLLAMPTPGLLPCITPLSPHLRTLAPAVAPAVLAIDYLYYGKKASPRVTASVLVVCLGVGMATITDPQISSNMAGLAAGAHPVAVLLRCCVLPGCSGRFAAQAAAAPLLLWRCAGTAGCPLLDAHCWMPWLSACTWRPARCHGAFDNPAPMFCCPMADSMGSECVTGQSQLLRAAAASRCRASWCAVLPRRLWQRGRNSALPDLGGKQAEGAGAGIHAAAAPVCAAGGHAAGHPGELTEALRRHSQPGSCWPVAMSCW